MAFILFYCNTPETASSIASDVQAGTLFSVSMGTTSKAASYSRWALVECTDTRADNIVVGDYDREDISVSAFPSHPESFTDADVMGKMWYLRGVIAD